MATTAIHYKKLETEPYDLIYEVIDNRSNVTDPRDTAGMKVRTFVYDSDPFMKGADFGGMPYIILEFPEVEQTNPTNDGKHKLVSWTQKIIVRTTRTGSSGGGSVDTGRTDMLNIGDDLMETFNSISVRTKLKSKFISMADLVKIRNDTTVINQETIYESEYELTYKTRMRTSA